jgi:hypothetical protein
MIRLTATTVAVLFVATAALGLSPPPIPARRMPPAVTLTVPNQPPSRPVRLAPPAPPLTRAMLDRVSISGAVYFDLLSGIDGTVDPASGDESFQRDSVGTLEAFKHSATPDVPFSSWATAEVPIRVTTDTDVDVESSIVAVDRNGSAHTCTTAIKYAPIGTLGRIGRIHSASTTNFSTFVRGPLPMLAAYNRSVDPYMSVNPYTGGIAPKRMYTVGVMHNQSANLFSAIGLWRSDNGGQTWSTPVEVEVRGGGGLFLDKPAVMVSWHSGSLGYVYVAYINIDFASGDSTLIFQRSTDGGLSFGNRIFLAIGPNITAPQIVVNSTTGAVNLLWADESNRDIRMTTSTNLGVSFGPHEIVATNFHVGNINQSVRAGTYPAARFHWMSGRIIVAVHGNGNGVAGTTDVYYTYKPCVSDCNSSGWKNTIQVNDVTTNDQFFPGIDYTSGGNIVISFYDRRADPGNLLYHVYYAYLNVDGTALQANERISTFASDPREHTSVATDGVQAQFIGDYQELWTWSYATGERGVGAFSLIPAGMNAELYLSRITF